MQPPPLPASPLDLLPTRGAWASLRAAADLALANAWALAALSVARDSATFLLHRLSQRATNAAAALAVGPDVVAAAAPNAWWLCLDPAFLEAFPLYQLLVAVFFALALPINVAVNASAAAAAVVLCTSRRGADGALLLPRRRPAARGGGRQEDADPLERKKKAKAGRRPPPQGPLAMGPGPWWAVEPWTAEAGGRQGGAGRAGAASCFSSSPEGDDGGGSTPKDRGRSGSASFATLLPPPSSSRIASTTPTIRLPRTRLPLGPLEGPRRGAAAAVAAARAALATPGLLWRAWCADLWVSAQSVPLQALALAVLPAPWAVPRLLAIQLAVPAAVLEQDEEEEREEEEEGDGKRPSSSQPALPASVRAAAASARRSVSRSCDLMRGHRTSYAWPFVAAYALGRGLEAVRDASMAAVPARWWADVPELPLAATALFVALRFLAARALELLPLAFYLERRGRSGGDAAGAGRGGASGGGGDEAAERAASSAAAA